MITINSNTRHFNIPGTDLVFGVVADSDAERKFFQCPRYVGDNLDLAACFIRMNYRNANGKEDFYLVDDMVVDGDNITFSWLLSPKVTEYRGQVKFVMCAVGPNLKLKWHTTQGTGQVMDGLEPDNAHVESQTADVVAQLISMVEEQTSIVEAVGAEQVASVRSATEIARTAAVNEIEAKRANSLASIPNDYTTLTDTVESLTRGRGGAVVCEVTGSVVVVDDASDLPMQGLSVFGKTMQVTTTGAQLANFGERTDSKGVTSTFANDTLSVSCDGSAAYQYMRVDITNFIKNNPGKILYLSYEAVTAATILDGSVAQINITLADGPSRYTTILSRDLEKIAYTIPSDVSNIATAGLAVYATNNATPKANRVTIVKPILHFGTTALPYELYSTGVASPSPEHPQELVSWKPIVDVCGKNLIPPTTGTISAQGITSAPTSGGTVLLNGTATQEISRVVSQNFLLQPGKYTLSVIGINKVDGNKDRVYLNAADGSGTIVNYVMVDKPVTFDVASSMVVRSAIVFATGSTYENKVACIQLEAGDTATEYEPYKPVQTIETTHTLRGIPVTSGGNYTDANGQQWICDEVDLERGVYVQRIGETAFDGTEDWRSYNKLDRGVVYAYRLKMPEMFLHTNSGITTSVLSDRFEYGGYISERKLTGVGQSEQQYIYFRFDGEESPILTLDDFKLWIAEKHNSGNPVKVTYILATPIETPLTEAEIATYRTLHSNYPNTTVLNDAGAHMVVKYAADTKLYIDKKIKEALK